MVSIGNPNMDAPQVSIAWRLLDDIGRLKLVLHVMREAVPEVVGLELISVTEAGVVTLRLLKPMSATIRGEWLRRLERVLRDEASPGIEVYVAPKADRNALRRLRGVEVKE